VVLLLLVAVYALVLLWNYKYFVAPYFGYYGYVYQQPPLHVAAFSLAIAVLPTLWMPMTSDRPSLGAYYVLYIMVYVPSCVVPAWTLLGPDTNVGVLQILLLISFSILTAAYAVPRREVSSIPLPRNTFWIAVFICSFLVCMLLGAQFGFRIILHSFSNVYDVREDFVDVIAARNPLLAYLAVWQANVIAPLVFVYGWLQKNVAFIVSAVVMEFWFFTMTGSKHVLFALLFVSVVLVAIGYAAAPSRPRRFVVGGTLLIVACSVVDYVGNWYWMSSLFVRRIMLTPGLLSAYYFEFYTEYPKALMAHSVLGRNFVRARYELAPAHVIGGEYFGNDAMSANANIWADSFANFGALGMIAASLVLAAFFWWYDSVTSRLPYRLSMAILIVPSFALANSALQTTLLTHGLLLTAVVVLLFPRDAGELTHGANGGRAAKEGTLSGKVAEGRYGLQA